MSDLMHALRNRKIDRYINGALTLAPDSLAVKAADEIEQLQARVALLESLLADQVAITGLEPVEASAIASGMRAKPLGDVVEVGE